MSGVQAMGPVDQGGGDLGGLAQPGCVSARDYVQLGVRDECVDSPGGVG